MDRRRSPLPRRPAIHGRDSSGRIVSLLQSDTSDFHIPTRKSRNNSEASVSSSSTFYQSSYSPSTYSIGTPPLSQVDSMSSNSSINTPSPITPSYPEPMQDAFSVNSYGIYPPNIPSIPVPEDEFIQHFHDSRKRGFSQLQAPCPPKELDPRLDFSTLSPALETIKPPPQSPQSTTSSVHQQHAPKKARFPCPYAKEYGCQETFTTSGHASRHSKKHTGEKNVLCPVCKKAFTRKDNMKQHERTHRKGESSSSDKGDTKKRKTRKATEETDVSIGQLSVGFEPYSDASSTPGGLHTLANAASSLAFDY
ncbi:MAG: hypothetical protein M1834_001831 [Cirrosporium novae-zelandiae]|nr:MAG: hypothetical protein M1834_001831 [Cirrosporium novae-zelandiae]